MRDTEGQGQGVMCHFENYVAVATRHAPIPDDGTPPGRLVSLQSRFFEASNWPKSEVRTFYPTSLPLYRTDFC